MEKMEKLNKKEIEGLDFEISFYENLLKDKPDFVNALILLGEAYTRRGFYEKGLAVDKQLVKLLPHDAIANYNLACSYSLIGDIGSSLKAIKIAIKKGYSDIDFMQKDPDLETIRKDSRFKKLVDKLIKERGGDVDGIWLIQEEDGEKENKKESFSKEGYKKTKTPKEKGGKKNTKTCRSCSKEQKDRFSV